MRAERDTRIDVIRAIVLLMIFINHVPGNAYETFTLKNVGFSDAAEVFVLVSGLAVGLAYGQKMRGGQWVRSTLAIWRRAWVLFYTHIMTTVATLAVFCGAAVFALRPDLLDMINIGPLIEDPARVVVGIATLGHQLGYNNILPLYMALLVATPAIMWLLDRSMVLTLAASGALWLAAGLFQIAPANYPLPGVWFLNPLSWQFLYVIGIAGMMHVGAGGSLPRHRLWTQLSVAYLVGAFALIHSPFWGTPSWFGLPEVLGGFNKTYLSLSACSTCWRSPISSRAGRRSRGWRAPRPIIRWRSSASIRCRSSSRARCAPCWRRSCGIWTGRAWASTRC